MFRSVVISPRPAVAFGADFQTHNLPVVMFDADARPRAVNGASPIAVRAAIDYFDHQLECMQERITGAGPFLMGEKFSIADILFMSCLDAAEHYELALPDYLRDYRIRTRARPAYAETYPRNYDGRSAPEV